MGAFGAPLTAADLPQKAGILGPGRRRCPTRLALVARRILSREQSGKGYASKGAQGEEESVIVSLFFTRERLPCVARKARSDKYTQFIRWQLSATQDRRHEL